MILAYLSLMVILTVWIGAIAILSIQNATLVSLKFLFFQSVPLPLGLILAFTVCLGLWAGLLVTPSRSEREEH